MHTHTHIGKKQITSQESGALELSQFTITSERINPQIGKEREKLSTIIALFTDTQITNHVMGRFYYLPSLQR